jgi:uncharacterized protein
MAGKIVHIEIPAADTEKARAFYGGLFGWEFAAFPPGSEYHMARIDDTSGAAVSGMDADRHGTRAYFDVDDIRAARAQVEALGGQADEPMPVPTMGWFVTCRDPHGNDFGLWQSDPAAPTPEM